MAYRILHLSDTHLTASGVDEDGVDAAASLDRILYDARHLPDLDAVVVSGDIADDGSPGGYAGVLERVGRFAAERHIPHVYCPGNHDDRDAFGAVLGGGHLAADGGRTGAPLPDPARRAGVSDVRGLRVVTLDSVVPGSTHGELGTSQLAWLRDVLREPAAGGSLVVLHHPPIAPTDSPILGSANLRDADGLAAAITGTDVRAVLCGHFHQQMSGFLAGVPVWVTPGVLTRIDLTAPPHLERAVLGASASVVDLGVPGGPMFRTLHARDPRAGETAYLVDAVSGVDVADESVGGAA